MEVNENDFFGKDLKEPFSGYILFSANWCGACKSFKPTWEQLSQNINVKNCDCTVVNEKKDLLEALGITQFPTILIYKDGKYMGEYAGSKEYDTLLSHYKRNLEKKDAPKKKSSFVLLIGLLLIIIGVLFLFWNFIFKNK